MYFISKSLKDFLNIALLLTWQCKSIYFPGAFWNLSLHTISLGKTMGPNEDDFSSTLILRPDTVFCLGGSTGIGDFEQVSSRLLGPLFLLPLRCWICKNQKPGFYTRQNVKTEVWLSNCSSKPRKPTHYLQWVGFSSWLLQGSDFCFYQPKKPACFLPCKSDLQEGTPLTNSSNNPGSQKIMFIQLPQNDKDLVNNWQLP